MSKTMTRIALAAAIAAGSVSIASAQGFDPSGANQGYPHYAQAGVAAFFLGELQGPMAQAMIDEQFASTRVGLYGDNSSAMPPPSRRVIRRATSAPAAPTPGYVTPRY